MRVRNTGTGICKNFPGSAGRQARSRLAWLDIALPQRGVETLIDTFPAVFRLLRSKDVSLPPFSVTSTLPSIMNGGKDFSAWSKKDDLLYQTLRIPVETVLERDGFGLADILTKLNVSRRSEAKTAAKKLRLIPED